MESIFRAAGRTIIAVRYRRSRRPVKADSAAVTTADDDRLRLKIVRRTGTSVLSRVTVWGEFISRSVGFRPPVSGWMGSFRLAGSLSPGGRAWGRLSHSVAATIFRTSGGVTGYAGESGMPDRISSVALSGYGARIAASMTLRGGSYRWLSIMTARTFRLKRGSNRGDLEIYASASYYLDR